MPRIKLKPNSPEYQDKTQKTSYHRCEFPHCPMPGTHKAPKHRGLNEYHLFCLDHVKDYNNSWDFFSGMSAREVEEHMLRGMYGDRPTWRYDTGAGPEDFLHRRAWETYQGANEPPKQSGFATGATYHHDSPEYKAMAILEIKPPLDLKIIKAQYKKLAKKHHPDHNPDDDQAEERLKDINLAYSVLKEAFERFEKMEKK